LVFRLLTIAATSRVENLFLDFSIFVEVLANLDLF
jgi:hypothetical protein